MSTDASVEHVAASSPDHTSAHEIRITAHGKMQAWVDFALRFFEDNDARPLTLHTLPATTSGTKKKCGIPNSTLLVPRLASVVEIIKREYLKKLDTSLADGSGSLSGLYQYNELGEAISSNDGSEAVDSEEQRSLAISHALSGKKFPKLRQKSAFMKITLCRAPLPDLATRQGITYQKPAVRRLTKTAKARAKKRMRREAQPNA
ncbi:hypothetical protein BC629DRAFT_1294270 [Irpex lacteus]|nr:hypothetical protein BC629DRAFT_1294270 [Irpex lacteus]